MLKRDDVCSPGVKSVTLGIASSPFSGSGKGTIELMLRGMVVPAVRYENGVRIEEPKIRRGPSLDFGGVVRGTGVMSLAEPFMVRASTGAKKVDVLFAPKPGVLVPAFTMIPGWLAKARWFQAFMRGYFTVLRRVILSAVATSVELVAEADGVRRWVKTRDGMEAGGFALAAMAEAMTSDWVGVKFIDDVCALEPTLARANALAGSPVFEVSARMTQGVGPATTRAA